MHPTQLDVDQWNAPTARARKSISEALIACKMGHLVQRYQCKDCKRRF